MEFDKRLWMAQWAGDGARVQSLAGDLTKQTDDMVLQENLFEAQVTAVAASALNEGGVDAAITAVEGHGQRVTDELQGTRALSIAKEVAQRIENKLRALKRQMEFKERMREGRTEFFVDRYLEERDQGHFGKRFWRVGSHPLGRELRSYLFTRTWIPPALIADRARAGISAVVDVGSRMAVFDLHGERLHVHADSRLHCVGRTLGKETLLDIVRSLSAEIDELWEIRT